MNEASPLSATHGPPCGLLVLDKPIGVTSRAALDVVARPLKRLGVKSGHAGTLDPLASGVLVVAVGTATRLIEYVQRMTKTYRATIRLGATSDTLDADGQITEHGDPSVPTWDELREALAAQVGEIDQIPPDYSALKVGGARAYDLARTGQPLVLGARRVRIDRIDLIDYGWPRVEVEVVCGGGTYIRSIARDLGDRLACGGLIEVLTRTRIGPFALEDAIPAEPGRFAAEAIIGRLRPAIEAVPDLPRYVLDLAAVGEVAQGRAIFHDLGAETADELALLDEAGRLVAIGQAEPNRGRVHPRRVFLVRP